LSSFKASLASQTRLSAVRFSNAEVMDFPGFVMYPNKHPGGSHCSTCTDALCDGYCDSDAEDPGYECDDLSCESVTCEPCAWAAFVKEKRKRKELYIESIRPESTTTKHAKGGGGGAACSTGCV